jgi:hypothetical protein
MALRGVSVFRGIVIGWNSGEGLLDLVLQPEFLRMISSRQALSPTLMKPRITGSIVRQVIELRRR